MRRFALPAGWVLGGALALAACGSGDIPEQAKTGQDVPEALKDQKIVTAAAPIEGVTPMGERIAVLGLLNKRNGLAQDIELKPGEARRIGDAVVQLRACETSAPWESPPETGAFVRLYSADAKGAMQRRFSGWLFKNRPERNVVIHPIYDVFVKSCAMRFPGSEAAPDASDASASSAPKSAAANGQDGGESPGAPTEAPSPPVAEDRAE